MTITEELVTIQMGIIQIALPDPLGQGIALKPTPAAFRPVVHDLL
ncbi:hypothetical protein [Pseudarthrobacter phenanthrenivorans]|nr:hypothetical protein [Pseudarthrobacter phenanthrenivorans]